MALLKKTSELESEKFALNNEDDDLDSDEAVELQSYVGDISSCLERYVNIENSVVATQSDEKGPQSNPRFVSQSSESLEVCPN